MNWLEGLKVGGMVGIVATHDGGAITNQYAGEVVKINDNGILVKDWGWFTDGVREHMRLVPVAEVSDEAWRHYLVNGINATPLMGLRIDQLRRIKQILDEGGESE